MKIQRFIIIFTIWCVKGTMAVGSCTPVANVISINECSSHCNSTLVATGCSCVGTPSATIVDASSAACSIEPFKFEYNNSSQKYDLILNNTIDLDQDCMKSNSFICRLVCDQAILIPILITSKNEFLPGFCDLNNKPIPSHESIAVNETLPKGGKIWEFNVCDKDKFDTSAKQVSIKPLMDDPDVNGLFEINENNNIFTLRLATNRILDYDNKTMYILELRITDGDFKNVTLILTINVKDVDNKPPAFDKQIYYMDVDEGKSYNTYVGNVHAADEDTGINATIHYELESVNGSGLFLIDTNIGRLYANGIFDREKVDSYILVVKAYQEDNPINRFTFATVEVKINDLDDNPPVMTDKDYDAIIQENAPNKSFVIQIHATDADKYENNSKFFFEIVNHDPRNAFSLNSSTGIISVSNQSALDFENWTETTMTVRAVSLYHKNMSSGNSTVYINLTDMNDNSPQCGKDPDCKLHKDAPVTGSSICQVNATDADSKETGNGNVLYSILRNQNEFIPFAINNKTGAITLTKNISWPYVAKYRLDVVVEDQPQLPSKTRSTVCEVFVSVKDVNMFSPEIFSPFKGLQLNITEGAAPPAILLQVNASDKDPNDTLKYTIVGGKGCFEIDLSSGVIHVNMTLDREQISSYDITVSVSDHVNHTTQSTFHVNVLDINDNSPMFLNTPYSFEVVEETPDTIFHVKANDSDIGKNGEVKYELQNNYWTSVITINHTTGEMHVKSIDRENLNGSDLIQLLVIAKDNGSPEQSGFTWINITVKDINDHAPIFKDPNVTFEKKEGFTGVFYDAKAIDYDAGSNATICYRMKSGNKSIFAVTKDGAVSLQRRLDLDGRNSNIITLEIEAYNEADYTNLKLKNGTQTVILLIMDVNDNSPVFKPGVFHVDMNETLETGSLIGRVFASDADYSPEFNTVTYWITGGNSSNIFLIDSRTGKIYLEKSVDFDPPENQRYFSLQIEASDLHKSENGRVMNVTTIVNIQVIDQNDNIPVFLKEPTHCVLSENKMGPFNCIVQATDKDAEDLRHITYNDTQPAIHKIFSINQLTGEILAVKSLDFEKDKKEYTINVSAVDKAHHYGYHGLTIYLQDENDEIPMFFNTPYNFSVPENERLSTFVGRVIVRDEDKGSNLTFKLLKTTDFLINDNGEIFTGKAFDCENRSENLKNFIVQVNDTVHNKIEDVTVHVLDQNDESPIFEHDVYVKTINESVAIGTTVLRVNASDKDISKESNGLVKYKLLSVDKQRVPFSVDGITGDVKVAKTLTDSYQALYIFYVIAEDQAIDPSERRTNSCEVRINVTRDNLYPPVINCPSNRPIAISEAANVNSILLQVNATDEDQNALTYVLSGGGLGDFIINNSSGVITVNNSLDREKFPQYILTVQVRDNGHPPPVCKFYVKIIDINDNSPVFNQTNYTFNITEERRGLQYLGVIKASDRDEGKNQDIIYQIIDGDFFGNFTINSSTGELTAARIDRETFGNKAHLIIRASDQGKPQMSNITVVEVLIQDINDNPPVFQNGSIQLKVKEKASKGSFVYQLKATDPDEGVNAAIKYRKINGSLFLDVNNTGAILIAQSPSIDTTNNGMMVLYVEANNTVPYADQYQSLKNPTQFIQICIADVNDKPPHFNQTSYKFEINETLDTGSIIGRVQATDSDPTPEYNMIMYWIESGNTNDTYHIDTYTGDIYLIKALDVDQAGSTTNYRLQVYASDIVPLEPNQDMNQSTTVNIAVKDINDNPPVFTSDIYWCAVKENYNGTTNCMIQATDLDKMDDGHITYDVVTGQENFGILATGQLSLTHNVDFETLPYPKELNLTVRAMDSGHHNNIAIVVVRIVNIDDTAPNFINTPYSFSIDENSNPGTKVGSVLAVDVDSNNIIYTLNTSNFTIDKEGNLFVQQEFDYELQKENPVNIKVTASDEKNNTNNAVILVHILNINDNSPVFQNTPYTKTIDETFNNQSSVIIKVTATDVDYGSIHYEIIEGNEAKKFSIDISTGGIQCIGHLNASITHRYDLIIRAVDGGKPPQMNVTSVTIFLNDVNDNPPRFLSHVYWAEVIENEKSAKVLTVAASDIDANSSLTFSVMVKNESSLFWFDGNNLMAHQLDAEGYKNIIVHIKVSDGIHEDNATVNVTILDVNDNNPILATSENPVSIKEDTRPGSPGSHVANVSATDMDVTNHGFTYVLLHSFGNFEIDPQNGTISLVSNLNFQERPIYNLTVRVYDHGAPPKINETQIIINVNETNKNSPAFDKPFYSFMTNESDTSNLFPVKAKDLDEGPAGNVSYSIGPDHDGNLFEIGQFSGMIRFKQSPLYKETPYLLEVKAIDNATHPRSVTANVTIQVNDVNEEPVWISFPKQTIYVNNGTLKGKEILVVHAEDYDHELKFKNITYSLHNTSDFTIDSKGEITASHDLYTAGNYTVMVFAQDGGNLSINGTVHIEVLNIQITNDSVIIHEEHDPYCFYSATTNATSVGRVVFKLENQHDPFGISENGTVCTTVRLDRESTDHYELSILAEEESSKRKISQLKLTVWLQDINDNLPEFVSQISLQVKENAPKQSFVTPSIQAKDKDSSAVITYYILWQSQPGLFDINHKNGSVTVNGAIDREKLGDTYIIEVVAYDDSNKTHNATGNFTINIIDVNDESPIFNHTQYEFNVSESQGPDNIRSYIGKVQAYDVDLNDVIRYQITKGDKYGLFIIESSGDIYSIASLDYENTTSFSLTVVAYDQANKTRNCTVRINVIDINDNQPEFSQQVYTATFSEGNSSVGKEMNVSAKDKDSGINGVVSFSIESTDSRNVTGHFEIKTVNNTGIITIITPLDREGDNMADFHNGTVLYHFIVKAKDSGSPIKSSTADVNIYVTDINDCQPEFEKNQYYASLSEETAIGKSILLVKATDCDFNASITYSLVNAQGYFEIDVKGEIKLSKPVSIDNSTTFEILHINASDGVHNTLVPLNITVTDSNDHDPQFVYAIYNFTVPENDDPGAIRNVSIGQVNATDADIRENGHISYKILSQTPLSPMNAFKILPDGTIVAIGVIDREIVTSFSLSIEARDNGTRSRQGTCEVRVTVLDINDNSPKFDKPRYVGSVKESAKHNTEVTMNFPIHAEDNDFAENGTAGIRYSLNGTGSQSFRVNDTAGTIYTNVSLDRETQSQYNFTVSATDQNGTGRSSFAQVTIDILDENDCTPYFVNQSYEIAIKENSNTSSSIGKIIAYDLDVDGNASVQYHIVSGADDKFIIDSHTGDLLVTGMLDREERQKYILNVSAYDGSHKSYTNVTIQILDINDNCPIFYTKDLECSIPENTEPKVIGNFSAYDLDDGENGIVTVFMNDSSLNKSFSVDSNGTLRSLEEFDREKRDYYTLEIYATDHGYTPCISAIKVVIKIEDKNDNPPVFYSEDGTANITHANSYIVDQSPVGSILLVPSVRDMDAENTNNSHVTYSFEKGYDEKYFQINPATGAVKISSGIEINTLLHLRNISASNMTGNQTLKVLIMAQDHGKPSMNSTLFLTVFIEPLNEASPGFEKETYNFSVEENADADNFIGKVSAVVVNESISHLTYHILHSQDSQYIKIDSYTGNITTTTKKFDREIKNHYTFEIQVTDGRTPERTAFTTVELTIEDVNDNFPVFPEKHYQFEIPENVNSTNEVMNISATDADTGVNCRIHYILTGETGGSFMLNNATGILEMVGTLDRESRAEYKFTITAHDDGSPPLNSSTSVVIRVLDENDNSPIFYGEPYVFNISENDLNVQGLKVYANDSDFGENGSVVFEMTRDARVPFYINPLDGTLSLFTPLDYENKRQYLFEIVASDLGKVSRKIRTTNVTVYVNDIYDFVPHFPENTYEVSYNISQTSSSILNVSAGQGNITYELNGPNSISFYISKTTGHITLKDKLSPDVVQYNFRVVATDSITKANDSCMVIVHVIGGKVEKTDFTVPVQENYNGTFPQIIYDLNSTEELQGNVLYELLQVDPNPKDNTGGLFKIDNTSGILYCERKLDTEDQSQYVLTLRISHPSTDGGHIRRKRDIEDQPRIVKLLVIIMNVNDNPPTIQGDSLFFYVFKNTRANYIVGKVNAEDKDGDTNLRFNIIGKEAETFHIDPISGQIITLTDISSTNKMKFMLHLYVTDQDGSGLSSEANITILVVPEPDRLILVTDMNKSEFNKSQDILVRNMSKILGVRVFIENIEYHKEVNGSVELLDLDKSDVFIHATNETTGEILSRDELQRLLNKYDGALHDLFEQMKVKTLQTVPWNIPHTISTMGSAEIALICLAVVIGVGGIAAVCFIRWADNEDIDNDDVKPRQRQNDMELWELESQHGSTGHFLPGEAINPLFLETNFDERNRVEEATQAKKRVEYETQELQMELPNEIPGNYDDERTDSGVDNESSGSERQQPESPSISHHVYKETSNISEESDDDHPIGDIQIKLHSVEEPHWDASNDYENQSKNKDHPKSSDHSGNVNERNFNDGKRMLEKLSFHGSQVLLDATIGDTDDTDHSLETKEWETEEEMKEEDTDLSQSTSKSMDDTKSPSKFADDTQSASKLADDTELDNASGRDREQSQIQNYTDEAIFEENIVTSL